MHNYCSTAGTAKHSLAQMRGHGLRISAQRRGRGLDPKFIIQKSNSGSGLQLFIHLKYPNFKRSFFSNFDKFYALPFPLFPFAFNNRAEIHESWISARLLNGNGNRRNGKTYKFFGWRRRGASVPAAGAAKLLCESSYVFLQNVLFLQCINVGCFSEIWQKQKN